MATMANGRVSPGKIIKIYHGCEGHIESSAQGITVWHHKACREVTKFMVIHISAGYARMGVLRRLKCV